jgi:hypothetical protein
MRFSKPQTVSVIPASIAGVTLKLWWMRTNLFQVKYRQSNRLEDWRLGRGFSFHCLIILDPLLNIK